MHAQNFLCTAHDLFPVQRRAGIGLVFLDVIMAEHALISGEFIVRQFARNQFPLRVLRIFALQLRKNFAERRRKFRQRGILLRRVIVLHQALALNHAAHRLVARGAANKIFHTHTAATEAFGDRQNRFARRIRAIPLRERIFPRRRIRAHVGDLDADGAVVARRRVPRALLQVERLVNRPVHIQHEMHTQVAVILQHEKTRPAHAAHVEVQHELVNDALQQRQIPAAAAHALDLIRRQRFLAQAVAVRRLERFDFFARSFPVGLFNRPKSPLHAIRVVTAGVEPQHDRRAGVEKLSGGNDLIARAPLQFADARRGAAAAKQSANENRQTKLKRTLPAS